METGNKRKSLTGQVEEEILDYIQKTPLEVGTKMPNEFELAQIFGVSRSTIREAVRSLTTSGVLEVRRGSGTFVLKTTKDAEPGDPLGLAGRKDKYRLAFELLEVRFMVEPEIAARAAMNAEEEDLALLKQLCDETENLYMENKDHTQKDIEFHTAIARCSKNRVVEKLIPIINSGVTAFVDLTGRKLKEETIRTHRNLTNSIVNRDPEGARYAMINHLSYNRQALKEKNGRIGSDIRRY